MQQPAGDPNPDVVGEDGEFWDTTFAAESGRQGGRNGDGGRLRDAGRRPEAGASKCPPSRFNVAPYLQAQARRVHFPDAQPMRRSRSALACALPCCRGAAGLLLRWLDSAEAFWSDFVRPLLVITSLFELWSMGIWLGFLTEPKMAGSLKYIVVVDIGCNALYILDTAFLIGHLFLDDRRKRKRPDAEKRKRGGGGNDAVEAATAVAEASHPTWAQQAAIQTTCIQWLCSPMGWHHAKMYCGLLLALGMVPVQVLLVDILDSKRYVFWQVVLVLLFRAARVVWAFRETARRINQHEVEVHVDIRMHGASGSSWNRTRIVAKQFLIVAFFGHWFGCFAYALGKAGASMQNDVRPGLHASRSYFGKFEDEGMIEYHVGEDFSASYLLALYKGFNLNYEDLLPERPLDLMLEVLGSIMILLMKSYCIGSFFKFHQKREMEAQRFSQLMVSVTQYLDLYEVPPSLRKAVTSHFKFQQANHLKMKTLEVIGQLPAEVQKKLREHEVLPTVVDRNPTLFGAGLATDYCLNIAVQLVSQFLQPGEIIFLESEVPRELVFLEAGAVAFSRRNPADGQKTEHLMGYLRADRKDDPTVVGGVSLILGCMHFFSARVRAGADAVTLNMPRADFDELNATFPEQHGLLLRNLAEAHLLDVKGRDLVAADRTMEHENETFLVLQQDVRRTLQARQDSFNSSFTYAASKGDVKLVRELLQKRVDPNVDDYDKRSALHLAASEGMSEVLETLLEAMGEANLKDRWGSTPMQDALKNGYVAAARILHKHQGTLGLADPAGMLCTCAAQGNTIQMEQLLDFGVDPNAGDYDGRTALHLSSSEGHLPVVTFLTARKADVNVKDRWNSTPLQDAIRHGFATVASHLRAQGGRVDRVFVAQVLRDAASTGDLPMLKMLFETSVDVDQGDYDQRTALHLAAAEGQVLALNFLAGTAQAPLSPLDRWGSTPLQEALAGGHSLCVQLLVSMGAMLGPSAGPEAEGAVDRLAMEMGFRDGGARAFAEASGKLRHRLRAHMRLVEEGRARPDIFNTVQAQKFNKQVVVAVFGRMGELFDGASWLAALLQRLEPASASMLQLLRLLKDAVELSSEAKLWTEASLLDAALKKRKFGRSKGAQEMGIHRAFLNSMRYVPPMLRVLEAATSRVMRTVEGLRHGGLGVATGSHGGDARRAGPPVSAIVMDALLKELGWIAEDAHAFGRVRKKGGDRQPGGLEFGGDKDSETTQQYLVSKLEAQAQLLLPAEHLSMSLFQGPLTLHGAAHDLGPSAHTTNRALDRLREWLESRTRLALEGKPNLADPLPTMPEGARPGDIYGSLWPEGREGATPQQQPSNASAPSNSPGVDASRANARLVASELVLLALGTLLLEGWDGRLRVPEREQEHPLHASCAAHSEWAGEGAKAMQEEHRPLTQEDFQDLGQIFSDAAASCRGMPEQAQKRLKKLRNMRLATTKKAAAHEAAVVQEEDSGTADSEMVPEEWPIRVAKILSLHDKLSLDELTILVDVEDGRKPREDGKGSPAFGELSRERFVLNLLRCLLNHDETQNDVVASLLRGSREEVAALDEAACAGASLARSPSCSLDELYDDVDRMHELVSDVSGARGDADDPERRDSTSGAYRVSWRGSSEERPENSFYFWRNSTKSAEVPDVALEDSRRRVGSTGSRGSTASMQAEASGHVPRSRSLGRSASSVNPYPKRGVFQGLFQLCCGVEVRARRKQRRIIKRFKELDDDGEGIGTAEMAELLAVAFRHTLGTEEEFRWAYRVFELLNKADVGDLVTLKELLAVMPKLEEEIKEQQRKFRRGVSSGKTSGAGMGAMTRFASGLVVPPESPFLQLWDAVRSLVVVYYMFEVPMRFSYLGRDNLTGWADTAHTVANACADVFMALNILLTFFRTFVHPTRGVVSIFHEIRMHYVFGLFAVDLVACCPADLWLPEGAGHVGLLARPRATMRLLRLLHTHHLFARDASSMEASHGFFRAAWSMSLGIFTLAHFLACFWWLLGTRYDGFDASQAYNETDSFDKAGHSGRGSWTFAYVHRPGEPPIGDWSGATPYWWQYLVSFYWTMGRITSQSSPGNLYAASWAELAWICALFFTNVAVNGYCDGILVDKVIAGDEQAIEANAMRKIVDEYLQTAELPHDLVNEVRSSAGQSGLVVERQRMETTIAALPHSLKQRVARRTVVPRLLAADIFAACSESFMVELGAHCRIVTVGRDQPLAHPGEPANQLLILNSGRVGVISESGFSMAETTEAGDLIGEMPFIFNLKHGALIAALDESHLTVLQRADFARACKMYPEDSMSLRRGAMKVIHAFSEVQEEGQVEDDDHKSKAKSAISYAASNASEGSKLSVSTGVSQLLRRLYARELRLVAEKLREEEAAARQDIICKFVQEAADGEAAKAAAMIAKGEVLVDEGDYDQRTALHLAVCNGHAEVVKVLIEKHKASIHVKDRFGHTPVDDAVREKQVSILQYLVSRGAQCQEDADVATQLCQAAFDSDLATLKMLLQDVGVNANCGDYDKRTALHVGASEGHAAVVELLVELPGIDLSPLDYLGNTPLDDAMRHKHVQVRRMLHAKGAKMGTRNMGVTLCGLAVGSDIDGLRELAASDVPLGQGDYDARTALHLAASENRLTTAAYLLIEARVDPNPLDRFLSTPLDDAVRQRHAAMEALLRDRGGVRGSDPSMAVAVANFKEEKKLQEALVEKAKLEKEVKKSEVSTMIASLQRFREHPTLEDDIYGFVTHAANFRDLLLRLLHWSVRHHDYAADQTQAKTPSAASMLEEPAPQPELLTKAYREQLLERTCAEMDITHGRLVAALDTEVLPWLAGLSKAESRLAHVLMPGAKLAVARILEQLRGGAKLVKFVRHLWSESGPGGGSYQCLPVGLLVQRTIEAPTDVVQRVRLEAEALLWASGCSAGQNRAAERGSAARAVSSNTTAAPRHHSETRL